jgi:hypothetical protein
MTPEILRRLLSLLSANRAFAPLSRLTFGSTGPILIFHEVQEDPNNELRAGSSPEFLDGLVRGLIASGWDIVALDEALRRIRTGPLHRCYLRRRLSRSATKMVSPRSNE